MNMYRSGRECRCGSSGCLGRYVSAAGDRLLKRTREIVEEKALRISGNACEIVISSLGDASGMLGAAIYANNHIENE